MDMLRHHPAHQRYTHQNKVESNLTNKKIKEINFTKRNKRLINI